MRYFWPTTLMLLALGGCGLFTKSGKYSVYFQPYSANFDAQANETINSAADFAQAHPALPVVVNGYSSPPDPKLDVPGLSDQRAEGVKQMLIAAGVSPNRIVTRAHGITDPQNLPDVAMRRVDIGIGQ